ncbi:MAG TPA: GNVR domain-containing protein, partial [Candidatus Hydrogenedentes bacterium]|nr:GNVR domain-containing protein [Candidatus Hydrogenedentota bacterium]
AFVNVTQDRTGEVKSEVAILTSYDLAKQVVEEFGEGWILYRRDLERRPQPLDEPPSPGPLKQVARLAQLQLKNLLVLLQLRERLTPREEAIRALMDSITVDVEDKTNIIRVGMELKHPEVSRLVLDRLLALYLERHVDVFSAQAGPDFFKKQVEAAEADMKAADDALRAFRGEHDISSLEAQKETLLSQISELEGQLSLVTADADGLQAVVNQLSDAMQRQPRVQELSRTTGMPNYAADTLKERLIDLRAQEADLAARYADTHRPLVELRKKIATLEDLLNRENPSLTEVTTGLNRNYEAFEHTLESERAQLGGVRARIVVLQDEIAKLRDRLASTAAMEVELQQLTRERDLREQEYREFRDTWQRTLIAQAKDIDKVSNIRIVQAASAPLAPVRPNKTRNIALGILLGLFGGICYAFVREYLDDTINTTEAAEKRIGAPVLAEISEKEFRTCT